MTVKSALFSTANMWISRFIICVHSQEARFLCMQVVSMMYCLPIVYHANASSYLSEMKIFPYLIFNTMHIFHYVTNPSLNHYAIARLFHQLVVLANISNATCQTFLGTEGGDGRVWHNWEPENSILRSIKPLSWCQCLSTLNKGCTTGKQWEFWAALEAPI